MNPNLRKLQPYPFEKLRGLKSQAPAPPADREHIALSIGEPKHAPPRFVLDTLRDNLEQLAVYPSTGGSKGLRNSIAHWLNRRFQLADTDLDADRHVLPVNGTREALFAVAQTVLSGRTDSLVLSPNPFYQIYEGASLLAGAGLHLLNCEPDNHYLPDITAVDPAIWKRCELLYLCSPGNPTGAVMPRQQLRQLLELADRYDFIIASDECYSEVYCGEPAPVGLLQVCAEIGRGDFRRCLVFHSLSKRSNLPGLRSGFVAGDAEILEAFLRYRTYHGCSMGLPTQIASAAAWDDEDHVAGNRRQYENKFHQALEILAPVSAVRRPQAGFYLWLPTPVDDRDFARELYSQENVTVLPGSYLGREMNGRNPGCHHVRIALVAGADECREGMTRLRRFLESF